MKKLSKKSPIFLLIVILIFALVFILLNEEQESSTIFEDTYFYTKSFSSFDGSGYIKVNQFIDDNFTEQYTKHWDWDDRPRDSMKEDWEITTVSEIDKLPKSHSEIIEGCLSLEKKALLSPQRKVQMYTNNNGTVAGCELYDLTLMDDNTIESYGGDKIYEGLFDQEKNNWIPE